MAHVVHDFLEWPAKHDGGKIAVKTRNEALCYAEIDKKAEHLALKLSEKGVRKSDRVIVLLPNSIESVISIFAILKAGAIFVYLNDEILTDNLIYIINDSTASCMITNKALCQKHALDGLGIPVVIMPEVLEESGSRDSPGLIEKSHVSPDDIACLVYTSGSTGKPKAVVSTHGNMTFAIDAIQKCLGMEYSDVVGLYLPFSFDYGLYQIFLTFNVGATLFLGSKERISLIVEDIREHDVTGLPIVPSMVAPLITQLERSRAKKGDVRLRIITSTGARLTELNIKTLTENFPGCKIFSMYGLTECKRVSILASEEVSRKGKSVGKPLPGTKCFIVDQQGNVLPPNTIGELVVVGPHVMQGYWNDAQLTDKHFRFWNHERALFTGDLCHMDEEGYLYFDGRTDDIFKYKGYRLNAIEIENAVKNIEGVKEAAVVVPSVEASHWYLFLETDLTREQVYREIGKKLEKFKQPSRMVIMERLPLTAHGKVDKMALRRYMMEGCPK